MLVIATRKKVIENTKISEIDETGEDNENYKNKNKGEYLKTNSI